MDFDLLRRQAGRYLLTGGSAAVVEVSAFAAMIAAGTPVVPAATLSFLAGSIINYLLASRFVFHRAIALRRYLMFLAGASVGLVINVALTGLLAAHTQLPPVAAKIVAIGIAFIFNFAVNALLVFRHQRG
jgi:putative flippase GtrA